MSDPLRPVPFILAPDDPLPVELINAVHTAGNAAAASIEREHRTNDRGAAAHATPAAFAAVARFDMPTPRVPPDLKLSDLVDGAGRVAFAAGFKQAPRFVRRNSSPVLNGGGYFLEWEVDTKDPDARQLVAITHGWSGVGMPVVGRMHFATRGALGWLRIRGVHRRQDKEIVPPDITQIPHIGIAIHLV